MSTPSLPPRSDAPRLALVSQPDGPAGPYRFTWPSEGLTSFVGREEELAATSALLTHESVRLVTLTGPGGVGKTRLAIRLSEDLAHCFRDGVVFVLLSSIADPGLLLDAIGQALGVLDSAESPLNEQIRAALMDRELLLVLDNFEQISPAATEVANLLGSCRGLKVLVTSRVPLRLVGEREFAVQPLALPDEAVTSPDDLADVPSVALFVQRAQAVRTDFNLREHNASAVAAVCRKVDGLPLAIELAAARSKVLSPAALLARLGSGLDLLTGGPQDQPPRLRTLRAAIAWSYDLLPADEQQIFCQLAVFDGGFSLDAAEAVSRGVGTETSPRHARPVLDALTSLVDASLLRVREGADGEPRFSMLMTMREFGLEQLKASRRIDAARDRHAAYFLELAEDAEPDLYGGPRHKEWLDRLDGEIDNLRAALGWVEQTGDGETMQRLIGALFWFWYVRGHVSEGRRWAKRALACGPVMPGSVRAKTLLGAGMLAHCQNDDQEANVYMTESLRMFREAGDIAGEIHALGELSVLAEDAGDYERAFALADECFALYRGAGERGLSPILMTLLLAHIGVSAWGQGDLDRAFAHWEAALERHRALDDAWGAANVLGYLALVACEQGDLERAARLQHESLTTFLHAGSVVDIVDGISKTATIAGSRRDHQLAARLFGAADALDAVIGSGPAFPELKTYQQVRDASRAALGAAAFTAAYASGQPLSVSQAAEEALAALLSEQSPAAPQEPIPAHELTPRETDVLKLLVHGKTDREIADALFISPRTAQGHVGRIFDKLGVNSRSAAVATALSLGLVAAPGPGNLPLRNPNA